ncbi:MAG: hypothetical protein E7417_01785 [Ruminococcaceae bacterium]|nr:hypothetical protein [Oscillospiraceae bacterium]
MKNLLKSMIFVLVFLMLFSGAQTLLSRKETEGWWNTTAKIDGFYNSEKNEYDAIFFGSSNAYCSFNPLVIWKETGNKSYVFATQQQPVWATYHYMVDAFKTQSPELVVMDVLMFSKNEEKYDDGVNYTFCDNMPFSRNKVELVYASVPKGKRFGLLCNFVKYHSRWSELKKQDFEYKKSEMKDYSKGFCVLSQVYSGEEIVREDVSKVSDCAELLPKNEEYLKKIIALCKEKNTRLLLVKTPSNATAEEKKYYNAVEKIAVENGVDFVDYNLLYDEIGIDMKADFYDDSHLNAWGAEKFSAYFANSEKFLEEKTVIEDDWDADYQKYLEETQKK